MNMENITIYYKENSDACTKAMDWFEKNNITVNMKKIDTITHREIFQLIYLSGLDVSDILRKLHMYSFLEQKNKWKLNKLRFGESLSFLERHTELLELPIVLSNEKAVSGYNEEQLKSFLL
ncbi:hypothetical protein BZZ03_11185 [Lactococcus petauri]|uniref:Arsenate reductase n=2 Tax=Lactococcus petauri TaxID=1940789 RepID=A0A252CAY3_9LACT|nr:hypothetical protein BZZ03_11185 [Lactococcus petauri]